MIGKEERDVCICIYIYIYTHAYLSRQHMCMFIEYAHVYVHANVHIHIYVYTSIYIWEWPETPFVPVPPTPVSRDCRGPSVTRGPLCRVLQSPISLSHGVFLQDALILPQALSQRSRPSLLQTRWFWAAAYEGSKSFLAQVVFSKDVNCVQNIYYQTN